MGYVCLLQGKCILFIIVVVVMLVLMVGIWLWSQKVEYCVLFVNFNDCDGGVIVVLLQQMNVFYKYLDGGMVILVFENMVYDVCLKLVL